MRVPPVFYNYEPVSTDIVQFWACQLRTCLHPPNGGNFEPVPSGIYSFEPVYHPYCTTTVPVSWVHLWSSYISRAYSINWLHNTVKVSCFFKLSALFSVFLKGRLGKLPYKTKLSEDNERLVTEPDLLGVKPETPPPPPPPKPLQPPRAPTSTKPWGLDSSILSVL